MKLSKEELQAQGREQTLNMFKSCKGALMTGFFFGEHSLAIADCIRFLEALIDQNEKKLAEERAQVHAETTPLKEVLNDEENA